MLHVEQITLSHCLICGGASEKETPIKDHMVSKETFNVQRCAGCGFWWTSPRPALSEIGRYYDSPDYLSHHAGKRTFFSVVYNSIRWWAAGEKVQSVQRRLKSSTKGTWLDVGCGIGVFLERAQSQGYAVEGVELSDSARAQAEARLGKRVAKSLEETTGTYQAITLWHVLEHLPNPEETLVDLWNKAEPGAVLAVAVPNPLSWDAQHYGTDWAAWDVPIHFWHFTPASMKTLMERTGWKTLKTQPMWVDAFYVSLLSESFRHGRKKWISAVWNGLKSNWKGKYPVNTSSLVHWAQKEAI